MINATRASPDDGDGNADSSTTTTTTTTTSTTPLPASAIVDVQSGSAGRTALHEASRGQTANHATIVELLHKAGAQLESADVDGNTPLLLAVDNLCHATALKLLECGANEKAVRSKDQKSALDVLAERSAKGNSDSDQKRAALEKAATQLVSTRDFRHTLAAGRKAWVQNVAIRRDVLSASTGDDKAPLFTFDTGQASPVETAVVDAIEKVRIGSYNVLEDTIFELDEGNQPDQLHSGVFAALAYASAVPAAMCDVRDIASVLDAYERQHLSRSASKVTPISVSPLYFLAHARYAHIQSAGSPAAAFLYTHFRSTFPHLSQSIESGGWCTDNEVAMWSAGESGPSQTPTYDGKKTDESSSAAPGSLEARWAETSKRLTEAQRKPMDKLMALTGLKEAKAIALNVYRGVLADAKLKEKNLGAAVGERVLNFAFLGNPGTGKSTVGRLFAELLEAAGARAGHKYIEMTAAEALRKGPKIFATELASLTGGKPGVGPPPKPLRRGMQVEVQVESKWYPGKVVIVTPEKNTVDVEYADGTTAEGVSQTLVRAIGTGKSIGGVLFFDEAYDLDPAKNRDGAAIMSEIMSAAEDHRDKVTIILAGYRDDVENKLYAYNPGMASRFVDVQFSDFDESQLHDMWENLVAESKWQAEDGLSNVAARRVARGIGQKRFGNGRSLRKLFLSSIEEAKQDYVDAPDGDPPKLLITHVIGKEPTRENLPGLDKALRALEANVGLVSVKEEVGELVEQARNNWHKELRAEKIDAPQLNRLFLGNPGTGKTSIAKIYGKILAELRLLSKGTVMIKTASDFKGSVVGASEANTNAILELAQGQVLLIDEAYVLNDAGSNGGAASYGTQVLDTIVEKVQGNPGDDIAVIMAGYKPEMLKMLRDQNPGLTRRFNPESALQFEDFSDTELLQILGGICRSASVRASIQVKRAAIRHLSKRRALPNFGNAGAVTTMVTDAKRRMVSRCKANGIDSADMELSAEDFVGGTTPEKTDPLILLDSLADVGEFKTKLAQIGKLIKVSRAEGRSTVGIVSNFVFTGPPGTGKTTVARKMGAILHAYGITAREDVLVTSAEDLTGEYVGHTKAKVEEQMQAARGGVLFIDEAYALGSTVSGGFGNEAITKLLSMLTEPEYMNGKTVVVLAGYETEMHQMLARNPGMKSRFTPEGFVAFPDWSSEKCFEVVAKRAEEATPTPYIIEAAATDEIKRGFEVLKGRPGWANARDAHSLYSMVERNRKLRVADSDLKRGSPSFSLFTFEDAKKAVDDFIASRPEDVQQDVHQSETMQSASASASSSSTSTSTEHSQANEENDGGFAEDEEEAGEHEHVHGEGCNHGHDGEEGGTCESEDGVDAFPDNLPDDEVALQELFEKLFAGIGEIKLNGKTADILNQGGALGQGSLEGQINRAAAEKGIAKSEHIEAIIADPLGMEGIDIQIAINSVISKLAALGHLPQDQISYMKREVERAAKKWLDAQKEARRLAQLLRVKLRTSMRKAKYKCGVCGRPWGSCSGCCTYMGPVFDGYIEVSGAEVEAAAQKIEANQKGP